MGLERFSLVSLFSPFPQASEEIGNGSLSLKDSFFTSSARAYRISCSLSKWEFLESRDRVNQLQSLLSKACRSVEHCLRVLLSLAPLWHQPEYYLTALHATEGDGCQESNGRPKAIKQTCHFKLLTLAGRNNQSLSLSPPCFSTKLRRVFPPFT